MEDQRRGRRLETLIITLASRYSVSEYPSKLFGVTLVKRDGREGEGRETLSSTRELPTMDLEALQDFWEIYTGWRRPHKLLSFTPANLKPLFSLVPPAESMLSSTSTDASSLRSLPVARSLPRF